MYDMLPFFAEHPEIFTTFQGGHHVLRRSERYWARISTDLTLKQVLMRTIHRLVE